MTAPKYLNIKQLQAKLGNRSRSAVYKDLSAGRLPKPVKLGGRPLWAEGDIDAHLLSLASSGEPPEIDAKSEQCVKVQTVLQEEFCAEVPPGVKLRDYFAGQWISAGHHRFANPDDAAAQAYKVADAMMKAREEKGGAE